MNKENTKKNCHVRQNSNHDSVGTSKSHISTITLLDISPGPPSVVESMISGSTSSGISGVLGGGVLNLPFTNSNKEITDSECHS